MLKLIKKSAKYVFGIMPFAALVLIVNLNKSPDSVTSKSDLPVVNNITAKEVSNAFFNNLPCGFKAQGAPQMPEKPSFTPNNGTPILQYPAGNYPGTSEQISNVLLSDGKKDQLILQPDGNLVIYCISCYPSKAIWSSQTKGKDGHTLFFQTDGDLVLRNSKGKMIWHSNVISKCAGSEKAYFTLQDDGNLVMLYNEAIKKENSKDLTVATYLCGSGSTNDQASAHPGKIQ